MWSWRPLSYRLGRLAGRGTRELAGLAVEREEIAPGEIRPVPPVIILPGQAERITRTEFAPRDMVLRSLAGDPAEQIAPTLAWHLRDVDLIDGVLYTNGLSLHLHRRTRLPRPARMEDAGSGALYETWVGNRWFGNWLLDDCLSYRLAEAAGQPVTTRSGSGGHVPRYETLLAMAPRRVGDVHFDELIVFDDHANNTNRLARAQDMRRRLIGAGHPTPSPGVFLLRGHSGDQRRLLNEDELAARMARDFGFSVVFPEDHSVDELIVLCGGAKVVMGVEGSQLNHGIAVMPEGGTLFTLQPADRATTAMKLLSDRWQQRFAMVIGQGEASGFTIKWSDIARTMELIASPSEIC
ncbi:glycosyltransferase family 61 protein [Paracoccus aminophilus]|uniref:Glycosyltransferase 61 catalytic domain-containing protein n=1 Tax=Paracoccus aminophilus JCM 7686 TaxID=1367847 RepID=S5Y5W9_PARAH|nr:glycosyltransferase family 61 protein [Paracoccus aminophilus]AGT11075.1 hypothetical protein JCM7686_pAMI5p009 [Paracoccus aminophilus JCM 7686]